MLAYSGKICRYTGKQLTMPRSEATFSDVQSAVHRQRNQADREWFVLSTEPNMERKAASFLIARRFKTYLPEMIKISTRGVRRRKVNIRRPIFPGYVFLFFGFDIDRARRQHVETAPGVHKFLRFDEDYAVVPGEAMERLFGIEQELLKPKQVKGPSSIFSPGEVVRISDGSFSGLNAEIESLDDDERITILLDILKRKVRTQIMAEQVEKL